MADTEQILRLIQSIPSKRAEPFKLWLAEVGSQRLEQLQDPELSIEQAMLDYKRLGYTHNNASFFANVGSPQAKKISFYFSMTNGVQ